MPPPLLQNGSVAVPNGRSIAPAINSLLGLPFELKIATRDWHPRDHVSFAANHGPAAEPFTSCTTIVHPSDPERSYETGLWPVHCVQNEPGASLVPELDVACLDAVVDKGTDPRFEMYSAFYDPFRLEDSGIARRLAGRGVTHVFVVGLAADYCVKDTAESAADEGFTTYIVDEATKPVYPDKWPASASQVLAKGVKIVSMAGDELARVKSRSHSA